MTLKVGDTVKDSTGVVGIVEHIGPRGLLARVKFPHFSWPVSLWVKDLTLIN